MYAFVHEGKAYGPDGIIKDVTGVPLEAKDAAEYNKALEAQEIAWLKTGPDKCMLYMGGDGKDQPWRVQTWLGTVIAPHAAVGSRVTAGFQGGWRGGTYRRHVTCRIFGLLYNGWYMESSGDYVRLKRAKHQV